MANPRDIIMRNLPGLRSASGPFIDTAPDRRDGTRAGGGSPGGGGTGPLDPNGLIFAEDFNSQPDWTSGMHSTDRNQQTGTHTIPDNWYIVRQDPTWAPSTGHADRHEAIEILASNADKAMGGTGKCYVSWRDYYDAGWNRWNSDSILAKYFPDGYTSLYVEFYISFAPDWTAEGESENQSKIFRIGSWNGQPDFFSFGGGGNSGPMLYFDYKNQGGVRNAISFRGGPWGENYNMSSSQIGDLPPSRSTLAGAGDYPGNFTSDLYDCRYDGIDPVLYSKVDGRELSKDINDHMTHADFFGPAGTWTKIAFYVEMNSAPGVQDGKFKEWIDDQLIMETDKVTWVSPNADNIMPKWNVVSFGGNDWWRSTRWTNNDRREEWYAIDNIAIYNRIPEALS